MNPKVFVIILNYNGNRSIVRCLSSVYRSSYKNFEVVVVDNASTDGSLEMVRAKFSRAHVIMNGFNVGFATGNNVGIRFALEKFADYVFILNNDAYLEHDSLEKMVSYMQNKKNVGIVSPTIFSGNDRHIWFVGGIIDWLRMKSAHLTVVDSKNPHEIEYACGCAMLVSNAVFKEIGLFDERFFLYYEDTDFCIRARKKGFKIMLVPTAEVFHDEQSETEKPHKIYWLVLSGIFFFKKHTPLILKPWMFVYLSLRKLKNRYYIHKSDSEIAQSVRKAYLDSTKMINNETIDNHS